MGEKKNAHKIVVQKSEEKNIPGDLGVDGGIILNLFLDKCGVRGLSTLK
jgi:hypothetical protein